MAKTKHPLEIHLSAWRGVQLCEDGLGCFVLVVSFRKKSGRMGLKIGGGGGGVGKRS